MKRFALLFFLAASAHADPLYVSDKLVVNVYVEANQDSAKVATLESGDAVEALEKIDAYTHVRLPDSREGWIKSSYLSAQVPAIVRLKELEKTAGTTPSSQLTSMQTAAALMTEELKQMKEQNAALQTELAAKQAATAGPPHISAPTIAATQPVKDETSSPATRSTALSLGWGFTAALAIGTAALGFLVGYQVLARKIRRKYGNVKIY
jgi:SH3 domain protein